MALKLKGGINTEILEMIVPTEQQFPVGSENQIKQSIRMSQLLESQSFLSAFSNNKRNDRTILENLLFHFKRIIKEKFVKITPQNQLNQFNELLIKYFENCLVFIANDTDRELQCIQFNKEQELTIVIVMLILVGNLILKHSEKRYKYLIDLFQKVQANIMQKNQQPYFHLNTLSPAQL